ncbi:hypothetical protein TUMEXPCC7403_03010 [Tumidithrix helvetica PCC 7403]|uniref:CHAT domain-containing protein n=1 Tax=Tumidithrix helvetica TaxID=3457545 RepID=UPI003CBFF81F
MRKSLGIALSLMLACLPAQILCSESTWAQRTADRKAEADILMKQGNQQYQISQFESALQSWQQALTIYQQIKDRQGEGRTLGNLGKAYEALGKYDEAIESNQKSLAIAQEIGDRRGEGEALIDLGVVYRTRGNYAKAIEYHAQSLVITREIKDRRGEGSALGNLGMNYYAQGNYAKAIEYHEQRLAIAREIKDRQGEGNAMGNLGNAYRSQGHYAKAIEYQERRLAITRELKDLRGEGQSLGFLGLVYRSLGNYTKSIDYYKQSLAIAIRIKDRLGKAKSLGYLGNVFYDLGDYNEAIKYHQSSLEAAREIRDRRGEGKSLGFLGRAYAAQGNYDKAIQYYESSLKIAQEIGDRLGEGETLDFLGGIYQVRGDYAKAIDYHKSGLDIARKIKNRDGERIALSNLGLTLQKQNQLDLSIVFYKQSVNVSESIRKDIRGLKKEEQQSYLNTVAGNYRRLADLLVKQGRVMEALQILDLLKVQELEDFLKNIKGNDRTAQGVRLLEPERVVSGQLTGVSFEKIPELNRNLADRIQQIPQAEINKVPEYLQKIPQGTVLLYPLILGDRLEIILFSPNTIPIHRTVPIKKADLEKLVEDFRSDIRDPTSLDIKNSSQKLYDLLIKPIEAELTQAKTDTVLYAPDGLLRYIPLAALYDGKQWLVEKYRTSNLIAYSLTDFDRKTKTIPHILAGAFGKGDPSSKQASLPATIAEVSEITKTFPNTVNLVEAQFSRAATEAQMSNHNILHLATHAEFNLGNPDNSFIIFGNGDTVRLSEIVDWKMSNIDLIVLSACQTGVGKLGDGVEILGFGYQVQRAGAKAAIASLWSVSDGGTQVLMQSFYEYVKRLNFTKAEALRQAQISTIRSQKFSHPFYWSAFILIGNGQ